MGIRLEKTSDQSISSRSLRINNCRNAPDHRRPLQPALVHRGDGRVGEGGAQVHQSEEEEAVLRPLQKQERQEALQLGGAQARARKRCFP